MSLTKFQQQNWQFLEFEDLLQMCRLVLCDLYYKGYYIHKNVLAISFNNYVLMHIRKQKNRPEIISLEQKYEKTSDSNAITIADMIPDTEQLNKQYDEEIKEVDDRILREMKELVIDYIGQRQYDQLLREYSNKQTTNWSRKLMQTIKIHLFKIGISSKDFDRYYN
jgi:hypothetical protein